MQSLCDRIAPNTSHSPNLKTYKVANKETNIASNTSHPALPETYEKANRGIYPRTDHTQNIRKANLGKALW